MKPVNILTPFGSREIIQGYAGSSHFGQRVFFSFRISSIKQWLADKGLIQQPPKQGGGCGV